MKEGKDVPHIREILLSLIREPEISHPTRIDNADLKTMVIYLKVSVASHRVQTNSRAVPASVELGGQSTVVGSRDDVGVG